MNIVTDSVKDDRLHNVKKADEIHSLVQDLALGIVDTILLPPGSKPGSPEKYGSKPNSPNKRYRKKTSTPASRETPRHKLGKHEDPEEILARALRRESSSSSGSKFKPRPPRSPKKGTARTTCIDKLGDQIVEASLVDRSGSSRTSSGVSRDCSDIDAMSYKLCRDLPKTVELTETETSEDDRFIRKLVPQDIEMPDTSDSDAKINAMIEDMIEGSIVEGEDTKSCASSLAEQLVTKSWIDGQPSTKTGGSSVAEQIIAESILNAAAPSSAETELASDMVKAGIDEAIEVPSEGSSFAEIIVTGSIVKMNPEDAMSDRSSIAENVLVDTLTTGAEKAMSKSPTSSLAEDVIQNLSPMAGNSEPEDTLADDLMEHVLTDIPSDYSSKPGSPKK